MWTTLRANDLKPHFTSRKDVSTFTAIPFDLVKKTVEAIANFAGIDTTTIAYKGTVRRGEREGRSADQRSNRSLSTFGLFLVDFCNVYE